MQLFLKLLPSIVLGLVGFGFDVSGIKSPELAYIFWCLAGLLLLIPAWPWLRKTGIRSPFYEKLPQNSQEEILCPVSIQFNPDLPKFMWQQDIYPELGKRVRQRMYSCHVYNESDGILKDLTCEVDRIIDIQNRPSDLEMPPIHLYEKFRFDGGDSHPTRIDLPAKDWQPMLLFQSESIDEGPIKTTVAFTSSVFHVGGHQKDVYLKFSSDGKGPKYFKTSVWVENNILRMTHFNEADS